jgi:hypothetical protein
MTQTSELTDPVLRAAEEAAGKGDFEAAERLLRELLASQESRLGSSHPDLANTLNNLAVVCERLEKYDDAERGYRRAHAIAVASLPPRHPFVATSIKNLVDFCKARNIPIWRPPVASKEPDAVVDAPAPAAEAGTKQEPAEPLRLTLAPPRKVVSWRTAGGVAFAAISLAMIVSAATWWDAGSAAPRSPETLGAGRSPSAGDAGAPPETPSTSPSTVARVDPAPIVEVPADDSGSRPGERVEGDLLRVPANPAGVTVMTAEVCGEFERRGSPDWNCTPVSGETTPRLLTFYTRLGAKTATTVEHRWYYAGRLHQTMKLNVPAQGGGYRTYSRNTVSPERTGEWKVELRTPDGEILKEEHFVVR